jgi:hypothetical protein
LAGDVSLADAVAGRTGKAERAVDWPPQDKTVLEGSPAWVTDAEGNRVFGATLTITEGGRRVESPRLRAERQRRFTRRGRIEGLRD